MTKLIKRPRQRREIERGSPATLAEGAIDIDPTEAYFHMDDIKRLVNLAGVESDNPASPAYVGDVVETDAEVVGKHRLNEMYNPHEDLDDGGEFDIDIDVPGGTVGIEFDPNNDCDDETMGDDYYLDGEDEDEDEDNMEFMNVIDRDDYRPTPTHPDQENMIADVEVDEDADEHDYGHNPVTKRGELYGRHTAHHQDGHAGMPIRMVPARSGDNPMLDPSRYGTISESAKLTEMITLVGDGEDGLGTAFHKIREQKASEMSKLEVIALTNAFISLLENKNGSVIQNVHALFHLLGEEKLKSFKDFIK